MVLANPRERCGVIRVDPTVATERIAHRLRFEGAANPVAAAVAVAARGSTRLRAAEFSELAGLSVQEVERAERGVVAFGALPARIGQLAQAAGLDLLSLADLERRWRADTVGNEDSVASS